MKPKYIQFNCIEKKRIDLRQSKAVLKYRPDLIFLEYPMTSLKPITKPRYINKSTVLKCPWAESDNYMWTNIAKLWKNGHNMFVYAIDGHYDLVNKAHIYPCNEKYPRKTTNLFWWIRIYLRECFMTKNIKLILKQYKYKKDPVILIFLQSFHWRNVQFLLSNPSKRAIWNFYFKRFKELDSKDIPKLIKKENKILFKYWNNPINFLK